MVLFLVCYSQTVLAHTNPGQKLFHCSSIDASSCPSTNQHIHTCNTQYSYASARSSDPPVESSPIAVASGKCCSVKTTLTKRFTCVSVCAPAREAKRFAISSYRQLFTCVFVKLVSNCVCVWVWSMPELRSHRSRRNTIAIATAHVCVSSDKHSRWRMHN